MDVPEVYTGRCATDDCTALAEIAGYCPPCAIARYRYQAVRPTPDRWTPRYGRVECPVDGCTNASRYGGACRRHRAEAARQ
jgi:hypothetical protein